MIIIPFRRIIGSPPSIRVYICHLRGSRGGQNSPRSLSSWAPKNRNPRKLISIKRLGFQVVKEIVSSPAVSVETDDLVKK